MIHLSHMQASRPLTPNLPRPLRWTQGWKLGPSSGMLQIFRVLRCGPRGGSWGGNWGQHQECCRFSGFLLVDPGVDPGVETGASIRNAADFPGSCWWTPGWILGWTLGWTLGCYQFMQLKHDPLRNWLRRGSGHPRCNQSNGEFD